jgi:hypothetical protein
MDHTQWASMERPGVATPEAIAALERALVEAARRGFGSLPIDELESLSRGLGDAASAGHSSPGLLAPLQSRVPEILGLRNAMPPNSAQARPMAVIASAFSGDLGIEGWLDEAAREERRSGFELLSHLAPGTQRDGSIVDSGRAGIDADEAFWLSGGALKTHGKYGAGHSEMDSEMLLAAARGDASETINLCRAGARFDSVDRDGRGPMDLCWLSGKQAAAKDLDAFVSAKALERALARAPKAKPSLSAS